MELSFRSDLNIFVEEDGFLTHLILRLRSLPEVPKINRLHLCFNEKFLPPWQAGTIPSINFSSIHLEDFCLKDCGDLK